MDADAPMETTELSCRELVELVTEYLEGTLEPTEQMRFEAHLADCDGCTAYLEQMRQTVETLGALREESLSIGVRETLLAAFRDWKLGSVRG
jgi:anti-sigma factor RsiW